MKEMKEMKEIPGHPNYKITKDGEVWSFKYKEPRKLKPSITNAGYYKVVFSENGKLKTYTVHQLVAMAYLNHKPDGYKLVVDHINGDQLDNNIKNLRLVSASENISSGKYAKRDLPKGVTLHKRWKILKGEKVYYHSYRAQISKTGETIGLGNYKTVEEASKGYQDALAMLK